MFFSLSYLLTGQWGRRKNATLQVWNMGEIGLNIVYRVHDVEESSGNVILHILPPQNYNLNQRYRFIVKIISGYKIQFLVNAHLYFTTRAWKTLYTWSYLINDCCRNYCIIARHFLYSKKNNYMVDLPSYTILENFW